MENKNKTGILIIDMQRLWLRGLGRSKSFEKNVSEFLKSMKSENVPCWYVEFGEVGRTIDCLNPPVVTSEFVVEKNGVNSFRGTGLREKLHARNLSDIVVSGVCATQCVLSAAYGAIDEGFNVVTSPDLIAKTSRTGRLNYLSKYSDAGVNILPSSRDIVDYVISRNR